MSAGEDVPRAVRCLPDDGISYRWHAGRSLSWWRWAPRCRSAADMGGVVEPVLGEAGVAVDADAGGFAVGERESSGQGQQQRSCRAGHRAPACHVAPSGRRWTSQAPASSAVSVASHCRVCPVPRMARADSGRCISHVGEVSIVRWLLMSAAARDVAHELGFGESPGRRRRDGPKEIRPFGIVRDSAGHVQQALDGDVAPGRVLRKPFAHENH
jgi:hypothetical protein